MPAAALPARHADADTLPVRRRAGAHPGRRGRQHPSAYERQWARFADWCAEHGRTALPATPETLAEFVVTLIDAGKGVPTISQAIATVRTRHRLAGHKGAPDADAARLALRSHRRDGRRRRAADAAGAAGHDRHAAGDDRRHRPPTPPPERVTGSCSCWAWR